MIFISKNESGRSKYDWIMSLPVGAYFVTRRLRPVKVGSIIAIQPGRGKKAGCWAEIVNCVQLKRGMDYYFDWSNLQIAEARLEGFETYSGLLDYFTQHKIDINKTWRILLRKVR